MYDNGHPADIMSKLRTRLSSKPTVKAARILTYTPTNYYNCLSTPLVQSVVSIIRW